MPIETFEKILTKLKDEADSAENGGQMSALVYDLYDAYHAEISDILKSKILIDWPDAIVEIQRAVVKLNDPDRLGDTANNKLIAQGLELALKLIEMNE